MKKKTTALKKKRIRIHRIPRTVQMPHKLGLIKLVVKVGMSHFEKGHGSQ
jgi:hypothetical protein